MRCVPMLAYHKVALIPANARYRCNYVTPRQFSAHLRVLKRAGYQSITFADYLAYRQGRGVLPRRPIIITFDDGYRSNHDIAWPLLRAHGFGATIFLVSGMLGGTNAWDANELQEPLLGYAAIARMQADGIEFQSHTRTHRRLTTLSRACLETELGDSRVELERLLGKPVRVVSYPWSEHDATVDRVAANAGYEAGVILRRRTNFDSTPLFALRRIGVNVDTPLARFAWDLFRLRWRGE